ncbi:MAG: HigA family addiction module antitoxin [Chloroflexi bacterium]|nr:HigA family addiction module antitoxin [Chloroflexota bacterium]
MTTTAAERERWQPDWSVPPGDVLQEALEERSMSQAELARRMGRPLKTINEIVKAKAAVTPDTAIQLERALGISAQFWNGLETNYRAQIARSKAISELEGHIEWGNRFPLRDLRKHGLVRSRVSKSQAVEDLFKFFGVGSPRGWEQQWQRSFARYRSSPSFESDRESLSAWLRWGEVKADEIECARFHHSRWVETVHAARTLTTKQPISLAITDLQSICANAGVAVVLTPEFSGTHLSGAAHWPTREKAVIQLSLRHKRDDQFWFTFFHEAGHLIESPGNDYLDFPPGQAGERGSEDDAEQVADEFAQRLLIPEREYQGFLAHGDFSKGAVVGFAEHVGIAPGIVVGRLQHDGVIPWSRFNPLKRTMRFV